LHLINIRIALNFTNGDRDVRKIEIPGDPKDYYVGLRNDVGIIEYSALRGKIRQLVINHQSAISKVIGDGGNPHTAILEINDEINDFFSKEPIGAQVAFQETFSQELGAYAASKNEEAANLISKTTKEEHQKATNSFAIASWAIAIIFFLVVMAIINH